MQTNQKGELEKLIQRRDKLRIMLRNHFSLCIKARNYKELDATVKELDEIRHKISQLKSR